VSRTDWPASVLSMTMALKVVMVALANDFALLRAAMR